MSPRNNRYNRYNRRSKKKKESSGTGPKKTSVSKKAKDAKERFLFAYLEADGDISLAAEEAGLNRCTHYDWLAKDVEYAEKFRLYQQTVEEREKHLFLSAYVKTGTMSISKAAEMIGIDRGKHYEWMKDELYAQQFKEVQERLGDVLEEEAFRRAVEGWDEPVFYEGRICGSIVKKSDSLLGKMLAVYKPKYKENREVNINNNLNVQLADAVGAARERLRDAKNRNGTGGIGTAE